MNKAHTQPSSLSPQHSALWLMMILLLVAAALRLIGLNNGSPPGLEHDEVAHWLINRDILAGNHAIYFTDAYGHEAGYHYFQTIFQVLLGDNAFALRLPSVVLGLLGIAVSFALVRQLFGKKVALVAAAYLTVLFFPIFYSRLALRAIALPVVSGLSAYFWWQGWLLAASRWPLAVSSQQSAVSSSQSLNLSVSQSPVSRLHSSFSFALSGLFAGLTLHTYLAARSVPIFYALFIGYLALFHRAEFKQRWKGVVVFGVMMGVAAAPLILYLLNNPGAEVRVGEVDAPLRALLAGDFRPVLHNGWAILQGFMGPGDPLWRQNVAFRAVFEPISALLFYVGVGLSLWRWRDSRYAFLLLWASTATMPSLVTVDAPSFIRMINILPILGAFPALVMHSLPKLSTEKAELSTDFVHIAYRIGLLLLFVANVGWTVRDTFITWPGNRDEVQFVWQKALTDGANYLDDQPSIIHAAIAGWTPDSMDAPTMELTLQRDDINLRYFNPEQTLVIPSGMPAEILRPTILPLHPELEAQLLRWGLTPVAAATFTHYPLNQQPLPTPTIPADTVFGDEFRFLGLSALSPQPSALSLQHSALSTQHSALSTQHSALSLQHSALSTQHSAFSTQHSALSTQPSALSTQPSALSLQHSALISYWQVIHPPTSARRMFVHLLDESGEIVAQDDGLDAAAFSLQPGDLVLLVHPILLPETYTLRLGVYDPETGQQLTTDAGDSFVILAQK